MMNHCRAGGKYFGKGREREMQYLFPPLWKEGVCESIDDQRSSPTGKDAFDTGLIISSKQGPFFGRDTASRHRDDRLVCLLSSFCKTPDGFLALFSARLRHTSNDQVMERPDNLKVDWASPVVIMDNGDHMEALALICQWFYYHAQGTLKMLITIVSKPVVPFFCHADREEGRALPTLHRHRFRREEGSRAHMLLPHPQKTHKNSTDGKQR
jgi:hypothetical protein